MSVRVVGLVGTPLEAKLLKQGSFEDEDLSLLMVDEDKLPRSIELPRMQLCEAPPWPGDRCGCRTGLALAHRLATGAAPWVANQVFHLDR